LNDTLRFSIGHGQQLPVLIIIICQPKLFFTQTWTTEFNIAPQQLHTQVLDCNASPAVILPNQTGTQFTSAGFGLAVP
jgi:hypothetical protein